MSKLTNLEGTEQNRPAAEKLEKRHRDSILKGEMVARRLRPKPFNKAAEEFCQHVQTQYTEHPNTARRIITSLASARSFFGAKPCNSLHAPDVERYKVYRLNVHKVRPITVRHDLNALSLFFQWSIDMEMRSDNPITRKTYKGLPSEAERIHVITPAEEFLYFERAAAYPNLRDVARLILNQGMRPEEVMTLQQKHFDGTHILIARGKTKAAKRLLRLTAESCSILEKRASQYPGNRWFFPSDKRPGCPITKLNNSHDKVCNPEPTPKQPKPEKLSFVLYDFRHTFATRAARDGMDVVALAAILGHSSLRMVMKYVHPQQDHIDASMDRISGLGASKAAERPRKSATTQRETIQ